MEVRLLESRMMRKYHVRFGGGMMEKGSTDYLASFPPNFFAVFGGLAFGNLGTAIGMWSKSFEHVGAVSMLILLPLIYLGGVFFSLENAHSFWQRVSHINPLYYIINGIRYGFLGKSDIHFMLAASVTFLFFIVCYGLALISLRKGSNYLR